MLPMLQSEPVLFGGGGGGPSSGANTAGHSGPLAPIGDLMDDSGGLFCEADVGFDSFHIPGIGCDLQLGDTWGGMQSKMSVVAPVKKIRKKPENNKPQSQINKCNNEKRRRELENETINQLEELLGACLSDVKQPDKNGIVQQAAHQIRLVLERRREGVSACCSDCPPRCAQQCRSTPVQAGEVSSTQPNPSHNSDLNFYSEITVLIEALKHYTSTLGWVLLEINCDGDIECVTENIKDIISWDRSELYKQSIYSYLHHGDHQKFTPILQNVQAVGWPAGETERFRPIRSRLLVKGASTADSAGFVEVLIHCAAVRGSTEQAASVMCVIRRCDDASAGLLALEGGPPAISLKQPAQITFKLERCGKVITCDLSGVGSAIGSPACRALEGLRLVDLVEPADRAKVIAHLRDCPGPPADPAVSLPFKIKVLPDRPFITVRAISRLFRSATGEDVDFVMSTHSILTEEDVVAHGSSPATPPVGGPLMTSVANGNNSHDARYRSSTPSEQTPFDFDLDFPQAAWEYQAPVRSPSESYGTFSFDEMPPEERKDTSSEGPLTPSSAPGTPAEEPNRLRSLLSQKPEPGSSSATGPDKILKDLLKQEDEEGGSESTSAPHTPHTPHTPAASAVSPLHTSQAHTLTRPPIPSAPPGPPATTSKPAVQAAAPTHNNSDMLLRILNEKSDEDSEERLREASRAPAQPSALLTQLLAQPNGPDGPMKQGPRTPQDGDNYLDRFIGSKRKFDDIKTGSTIAKRATPDAQQVTSSAMATSSGSSSPAVPTSNSGLSPLCQKNQILVSLLARQQSTPTTPLPSPNPSLRPFMNGRPRLTHPTTHHNAPRPPQSQHTALTNMLNAQSRATSVNGGTSSSNNALETMAPSGPQSGPSHLQMVLQGLQSNMRPVYPPTSHPAHPAHPAHSSPAYTAAVHQYHQHPVGLRSRAGNGGAGGGGGEGAELPNDQILSDLLDDVINSEQVFNMAQNRNDYASSKERIDRIHAITQSLMQVENVVKKSPSPVVSPPYSAQSPQGQMYVVSGGRGVGAPASAAGPGGSGSEPPGVGAASVAGVARARALAEQQRARLLNVQRTQHMLVPQGAEQTPGDLNNTIDALVSPATPPNVALSRTDYHHQIYHANNPVGSTYGTNKMTSQQQQQNPMLSAQLTNAYGQQSANAMHAGHMSPSPLHSPHTPLTPLTPQPPLVPYQHRPPRPQHMGGYYSAEVGAATVAGGYCVDYARRATAPPHHHDHALSCVAGSGATTTGGATSEFVRQEIRAVVGARARADLHHMPPPPDLESLGLSYSDMSGPGGGSVVGGRGNSATTNSWESHQSTPTTTVAAGAAAAAAAVVGAAAAVAEPGGGDEVGGRGSRTAGAASKASLLQKLLSE